jgi:hypothetical protein
LLPLRLLRLQTPQSEGGYDPAGNGPYISFATTADNMAADDNNNLQDIFIYVIYRDNTVMASVSSTGKPAVLQIAPLSKVKK